MVLDARQLPDCCRATHVIERGGQLVIPLVEFPEDGEVTLMVGLPGVAEDLFNLR
jgi:hypothetical protein